ncbi:acyltransferase family protein [Ancylobacter sp. TS-1]|uniref:acyltransferase family protein n=1 Tax=Ancylobacter sp. TS-1 TaxID=1850374 RepID=UPI001265B6F5|nr:acyltransferase family protein [Ancylobacter sp. TS-1]QFR31846.1 acyltransferase family protein [Ancylobacter sp. TS-1]
MHHHLRYRAHIDGLRAVAVLGVVLYHFGASWIPGGFVGVDVFFVISGYLISKSIYADVTGGTFSIFGFYERRIRRIAPAFLAVTAVTAVAAYFILLPREMLIFGRSVLWSVFAVGNFFFFDRTDYFGPAAQEMPLLHYWSLAVEEQFYFVFPVLVLVGARLGMRRLGWIVLALLLASLAASQAMLQHHPAAAYFLLPFRAFELLIGSVLALPAMRFPQKPALGAAAVLGGCAMILGAMVYLTSTSPFPGLRALIPCLGAALVIWGGERAPSLPARLLGSRVMVFFGAISYSLYLVHWPIVSLGREWLGAVDPLAFLVGGVALSTLLAYLSYRLVEQPVRLNRRVFTPKVLVGGTLAVTLALAGFAQATIATKGLPMRLSPEIRRIAAFSFYNGDPIFRQGRCFIPFFQAKVDIKPECLPTTHPSVMVWGSSHVAHFINAIIEAGRARGYAVGQITAAACPPTGAGYSQLLPYCDELNAFALDWVRANKPDILVLGGLVTTPPEFDRTIAELAAEGIRVVVIGPVPLYRDAVPKLLARRLLRGDTDVAARDDMLPAVAVKDREMQAHFAGNPDITYISVFDAVCPAKQCPLMVEGEPLQHDSSHFTQAGVNYFGRPIASLIFGDGKVLPPPPAASPAP